MSVDSIAGEFKKIAAFVENVLSETLNRFKLYVEARKIIGSP